MIVLLLGSHIFLTFRTGFIQRKLPQAIKMSLKKSGGEGDISPFGALATALAATIGTGSIVGVATAILAGGPGAVFWMWLTGVFGIATKYSEVYAAIKYRVKDHNGNMLGGAMYAWQRGFTKNGKTPWYARLGAVCFALFAAIAAIGTGSAVQASAMTGILTSSGLAIEPWIIGIVIVVLVAVVIFGGVKIISQVCERLVPIMAIGYAVGCLAILVFNWAYLGDAIVMIVECAFTAKAAFGGAVGSGIIVALQFGCARGLFSNESGLGSSPLVASAAIAKNPAKQALISMTGTFWDTVIVCALTALALMTSVLADPQIMNLYVNGGFSASAELVTMAFNRIPVVGSFVLCIGLVLFAYSTSLGWSYYGNRCITYLFGKHAIRPYQIVFLFVCFLGAIGVSGFVWNISDITNALMAIPNLIAVLGLSALVAHETKHYVWQNNLDEVDETPLPVEEAK